MNNNNLITIGTLILSVFVAGSFFGSDWKYRAELRNEITKLKEEQAKALAEVLKANQDYVEQQKKFYDETQVLYQKLGNISNQKKEVIKALEDNQKRLTEHKQQADLHIGRLKNIIQARPVGLQSDATPNQ